MLVTSFALVMTRIGHDPNWERPLWTGDDRGCPLGHPPNIPPSPPELSEGSDEL
jgi:hypothetical protein